jgi:hypothetical protein
MKGFRNATRQAKLNEGAEETFGNILHQGAFGSLPDELRGRARVFVGCELSEKNNCCADAKHCKNRCPRFRTCTPHNVPSVSRFGLHLPALVLSNAG